MDLAWYPVCSSRILWISWSKTYDLPLHWRRIFAPECCICSLHGEAQIRWWPALWSLHPSKAPLAFVCLTMNCCLWQVSVMRFWNLFWLLLLIQDAITCPHRDRCMFKCKLIWTQHINYRHNWSEVYITWKLRSWKISAFFLSFLNRKKKNKNPTKQHKLSFWDDLGVPLLPAMYLWPLQW